MFDKFREECGVFGIFGHDEAARLTYLGLYALQHRGQESAGIVSSDGSMLRVERGITRRELADALGVHYQTVGYLERGEYSPSLHLALRIARFFDVSVEVVFSLEAFPRLGQ